MFGSYMPLTSGNISLFYYSVIIKQ